MSINVGEYGIALNILLNYDIRGATTLSIGITRPDKTTFTGMATVGAVDLTTDQGTFPANKYAVYLFQQGDLTIPGNYMAKVSFLNAAATPPLCLFSNPTSFSVSP